MARNSIRDGITKQLKESGPKLHELFRVVNLP